MSGERVLVVDDEPIVTEVVQRYLIREGYQVSVAADGRAALKVARIATLVSQVLAIGRSEEYEAYRQMVGRRFNTDGQEESIKDPSFDLSKLIR